MVWVTSGPNLVRLDEFESTNITSLTICPNRADIADINASNEETSSQSTERTFAHVKQIDLNAIKRCLVIAVSGLLPLIPGDIFFSFHTCRLYAIRRRCQRFVWGSNS